MISTDKHHSHEHHDPSRAAGPSRQPNKPLPLPLASTSIPHQIIDGIPNSVPPPLSAFATDPQLNETLDVIPTRAGRKLCVRHKQMADQNVNEKLQKVSLTATLIQPSQTNPAVPSRPALSKDIARKWLEFVGC
jgi:hypothetical protein